MGQRWVWATVLGVLLIMQISTFSSFTNSGKAFADRVNVEIEEGSANAGSNKGFNPKYVTVAAGSTVVWTNGDSAGHTVTSGNPGDADFGSNFDSGFPLIKAGQRYEHTFNSAGQFPYFCQVHPWHTGKVTVTGGSSGGSSSSTTGSSSAADNLPSGTRVSTGESYSGTLYNVVFNNPGSQTKYFPSPSGSVSKIFATVTTYVRGAVLYFDVGGTTYSKSISPNSNTLVTFSNALSVTNVRMSIQDREQVNDQANVGYVYAPLTSSSISTSRSVKTATENGFTITLTFDKASYSKGAIATFSGTLKTQSGAPIPNARIDFDLHQIEGLTDSIIRFTKTTSNDGSFNGTIYVTDIDEFKLTAKYSDKNQLSIEVENSFAVSKPTSKLPTSYPVVRKTTDGVTIATSATCYQIGDYIPISIGVFSGGHTVPNAKVKIVFKNANAKDAFFSFTTDSNGEIRKPAWVDTFLKEIVVSFREDGQTYADRVSITIAASCNVVAPLGGEIETQNVLVTKQVNEDTGLTVTLDRDRSLYSLSIELDDLLGNNGAHTTIEEGNIVLAYDRRSGPQLTSPNFYIHEYNRDNWRIIDVENEWKKKEILEGGVMQVVSFVPIIGNIASFISYVGGLLSTLGIDPKPMPQNALFYNEYDDTVVKSYPFLGGNADGIKLSFNVSDNPNSSGLESGRIHYMMWVQTGVQDINLGTGRTYEVVIDSPDGLYFNTKT